jgi:octopine/nopaline transport system permease protein
VTLADLEGLIELLGFGEKGWGLQFVYATLMTLAVTVAALLIGAVLGSLVAWAKLSHSTTAKIAGDAYITVFRGVPELLIIYFFYFGGSSVVTGIGSLIGLDIGMPGFLAGALGVGFICGAYQSEVYRGAFLAISRGEIEAAKAMGMAHFLRFRRIIAPQVLRLALPGLGNVWQLSLKDSALVSVTGLAEIMRQSNVAGGSTHRFMLFYLVGGALYLVLTSLSTRAFDRAETHFGKGLRRGVGSA